MKGDDVTFVVGTDEHGEKMERSAVAAGRTPQEHCDAVAARFAQLWRALGVSYDSFVRTSAARHAVVVRAMLACAWADIFRDSYEGLYCVGCEEFKTGAEATETGECPIHRTKLERRSEENYFFRASRYQPYLEALLERSGNGEGGDGSSPAALVSSSFVRPASRRNEALGWLKEGLRDLSISRAGLEWGIPMPGDPSHAVYVWFDALTGYLTAILTDEDIARLQEALEALPEDAKPPLDRAKGVGSLDGEDVVAGCDCHDHGRDNGHDHDRGHHVAVSPVSSLSDEGRSPPLAHADLSALLRELLAARGWPASAHVVGKDILRFHAVWWPAMLAGAGLPPPRAVLGHGFLTRDGFKMGKSLGNVVDPFELVNAYGPDAVRYYLVADLPLGPDGDVSLPRLVERSNAALSNGLGNLLHRSKTLFVKSLEVQRRVEGDRNGDEAEAPPVGPPVRVPFGAIEAVEGSVGSAAAHPLVAAAREAAETAAEAFRDYRAHDAAAAGVGLAGAANAWLNERAPWSVLSEVDKALEVEAEPDRCALADRLLQAQRDLLASMETARIASVILAPVVPALAGRVGQQLGRGDRDLEPGRWAEATAWGGIREGDLFPTAEAVQARLEKPKETPIKASKKEKKPKRSKKSKASKTGEAEAGGGA